MTGPDVSVVIPTRNRLSFLRTTLASALRQQGVDLEVIVVDDGSDDDTAEVVAGFPDERVVLHGHDRPRGVGAARNSGIERARGRWIATLDDDDLWAPDKLAAQLAAATSSGSTWAYTGAVHFVPGPRIWQVSPPLPPGELAARLPFENVVPAGASNVLALRETLVELGGFDATMPQLADWDMWLRLLRTGLPAVAPDYLVAYRLHEGNMAVRSAAGVFEDLALIEARHADLRGDGPLDPTPVHYWMATMHWRAGQRAEARRAYLRAFRDGRRGALLRALRAFVPMTRLRRRADPSCPAGVQRWLAGALADD